MTTADHLAWRISSRSSNGENCVEVAPAAEGVAIRHSKHPSDGTITFPGSAWRAFVHDARDGVANTPHHSRAALQRRGVVRLPRRCR